MGCLITVIRLMPRDHFPIAATGFLRKPFHKRGSIANFAQGFSQRFSLFQG